ncbi:MAG: NAD(P)H-hydrate dehydratase [Archangium sp.]
MRRILTAAEMRAVDAASSEYGIPGSVLMENAGEALVRAAQQMCGPRGKVVILCGLGNNGGDGLVAARRLIATGREVHCELTGDGVALKGDAARNFEALLATGFKMAPVPAALPVGKGDVVIDALLGTGLSRAPEGRIAEAIERIAKWRANGAKVISADLPSGLDSDLGMVREPCVTADRTLAFGYAKRGQVLEPGVTRCGLLDIVDIGIPAAAERVLKDAPTWLVSEADARRPVLPREASTHKGSFGHVLVVAGSKGKTGAAALAAMGALRSGAGLVTVATRADALDQVMRHAPEFMGLELRGEGPLGLRDLNSLLDGAEGKSAVVIGPGIARGDETAQLLSDFIEECTSPVVLDADALNALVGHLEVLGRAKAQLVLTPHPGELARMLGITTTELQENRVAIARSFAVDHRVVLVLKGARTLIAKPDGSVFINTTGNPGMATGGTGDVLAGMVGSLIGQGLPIGDAAVTAVFVHGRAGDVMKAKRGELGLIAGDLLEGMTEVWRQWER